ncbi:hypothetical protein, partial [Gluconobacter oxydans]|uniref:hypothetical protein n=1 Tax=Gluconobacter oxydans TaxID=442 RepID=UPI00209E05EC
NVIMQNAKDDGIDTTSVTTAYNNLNQFMADILADPNHASVIDRAAYKKYQDAYNVELANIQNALQNNANNKFASAANAESQAAIATSQAFSAADSAVSYANSEIAVQSSATDKAQSAADSAFSQAKTAIDTGQVTSEAVTALKDGSTLTIAQLGSGLATKVSNSEYASYKTQTASQVAQMVTSGAFTAYSQATAELISAKVATSAFSAYQETTASAISSKVESQDFNTYKSQTADAISSKVSNGDFTTYKTQTANDINLKVTKGDLLSQINMQAGKTLISASNQLILSSNSVVIDSDNPVIMKSANIDTLLDKKTLTAADISANTFSTNNDTFTVDSNGAITATNMTINGGTINTPNLILGANGQLTGSYSVNDSTDYFQPINGTGSLNIDHGYIQSTANIIYYNKLLNGIGGDKWGHWESSTQFVPFPDQANPDTGNVAESTLTPAYLKLDIFNADQSSVNSRAYIDGTGLYINDGGTEAVVSMLSGYELLSNGMAYLNSGIQMKQDASFTFGNLAMNGYHSIAMLDGKALYFTDSPHTGGSPIEIAAKTFTKSSRLSIKHDITPLSTVESSRLLNAIDVEKFRYTHDGATLKYQYGGVIDDVNSLGSKRYSMPPELLNEDGTGINLDSLTGILIKRVQDQDKMIGKLSLRLTKLEMEK